MLLGGQPLSGDNGLSVKPLIIRATDNTESVILTRRDLCFSSATTSIQENKEVANASRQPYLEALLT
jgi:hypothetical protein